MTVKIVAANLFKKKKKTTTNPLVMRVGGEQSPGDCRLPESSIQSYISSELGVTFSWQGCHILSPLSAFSGKCRHTHLG